jgi:hypothetical protein
VISSHTITMNTIAVTGPNADRDRDLLHAYFGADQPTVMFDCIGEVQAQQLVRNKWSILPYDAPLAHLDEQMAALVAHQQAQHAQWRHMLALAIALFDQLAGDYVLMKALGSPYSRMSDVDFLVPNPKDIATIVRALEEAGFTLYRFRLLSHPLKVMAVQGGISPEAPPCIDLYPDAMWVRRHVLDGAGVVARRRRDTVRGIAVWGPCREDDLLLVATHAFAHGRVSLAELDHGARLIDQPEFAWSRLIERAGAFGCLDSLYIYLSLLAYVMAYAGMQERVPAALLDELGRRIVNRAPRAWLQNVAHRLEFPIRLPLWLSTVRSAFFHIPAVSRHIHPRELLMDTAAHGMAVATHMLGRD